VTAPADVPIGLAQINPMIQEAGGQPHLPGTAHHTAAAQDKGSMRMLRVFDGRGHKLSIPFGLMPLLRSPVCQTRSRCAERFDLFHTRC
jgi:hypothetical protein